MDNCKRSISNRNELLAHGSTWKNLAIIMLRGKKSDTKDHRLYKNLFI